MKHISLFLLFAVVVAGVHAEPIRVGVLRGPTALAFAPAISSEDDGEFAIEVFPSPDVLIARMISGDVDAATLPSNVAAQLYNRGIEVRIVSTFLWGVLYLVGPGLEGLSLSGIEPREILVPGRGATPDLVIRYLLSRQQSGPELRYGFSPVEISQLLISGRAELAVLPEPFVTRALAANSDLTVVNLQDEWQSATNAGLPQTVLVTVGESTEAEHQMLRDLLDSSVQAVHADPARAFDRVEDLGLGLDTTTAVAALPRLNLRVESGVASRPALEAYFVVLTGFVDEAIGGPLPEAAFYGF